MHPLEVILQLQLGSDQAAVLSIPSILSAITPAHFEASPHLQKWISRVMSLMHSKQPGARWAGLCLALQMSEMNKDLMMESAQNWVGVALPMLSRDEAPPTWNACIRLLEHIFIAAVALPEFQRQLATPNVPKFSAALLNLAQKSVDVRHTAFTTLTRLIPLYPTLHRAQHPALSALSFRFLAGSATSATPTNILDDACGLHAVLHFTGGKVGAALLWRKSLDTALANAWFAFGALRTTFPLLPRSTVGVQHTLDGVPLDPVMAIPLSMDRLRCAVYLIQNLLTAVTLRPVIVPVGELVKLGLRLLRCAPDEADDNHPDATRRVLEISVIPEIWRLGCDLVAQLAKSVRHHLNPHLSRIVSHVTHHLEQPLPKSHRVLFLRVLPPLLNNTHPLHTPIPPTRLVKALLPLLTVLLSSKAEVQQQLQEASSTTKKGKKRARAYEGDEVFRIGRGVLCPMPEDGETVVTALDVLEPLLSNSHLAEAVRTLAARLLVTLLLELPRNAPGALSPDLTLHGRVHARVIALCNKHVLAGASGWVNSAVGLVVNAVGDAAGGSEVVTRATGEVQHALDVLLHPRLPPLLRAHPPLEALTLFRSGNAKEDREAREALGVGEMEDVQTDEGGTVEAMATAAVERAAGVPAAPPPLQLSRPPEAPIKISPAQTAAPNVASTMAELVPSQIPPLSSIYQGSASTPAVASPSAPVLAPASAPLSAPASASELSGQIVVPPAPVEKHYEDSEDEDEEMPEIDMGSDSD